ncbi:hypothetical protein [Chelatococcus asaccharovorans]|uniref:hypothetical protein n=1 Tax=Chelatococcus asaccharovorans TaxID=28210 RepID=UPI00224C71D0|nr:hypothetical protein [Chelatococcus asaccharovorans]CAH1670991.1 conserved hypothetical protein [Chelatococcus asaccharovorans]CAH1677562.1 conserved hypothetical protein [Chelatococcus asaccharovorans]
MSFFWRCALCIAAIYWFSPVHEQDHDPRHSGAAAAAVSDAAITGSVGKAGLAGILQPRPTRADDRLPLATTAEQAARLLNSLDAATRRRLIDALISTQTSGETKTPPK